MLLPATATGYRLPATGYRPEAHKHFVLSGLEIGMLERQDLVLESGLPEHSYPRVARKHAFQMPIVLDMHRPVALTKQVGIVDEVRRVVWDRAAIATISHRMPRAPSSSPPCSAPASKFSRV